jgi:hypothetical protein
MAVGLVALPLPALAQDPGAFCTRVASTTGSDSNVGTLASPYRTAQKLVSSISAGQTGCLRGGTYSTQREVTMDRSGRPDAPITLRSYPGERGRISARFRIKDSANNILVRKVILDGSNAPTCSSGGTCDQLPSPSVYGDNVAFEENEVTNRNTGICFLLGSDSYGRARNTTLEGNRIHDCGRVGNNYDHGVYMSATDGARIVDNKIYDNASRGVKISPDSQGTVVRGNIIHANGVGVSFGGLGSRASNDALVEGNIISSSHMRWNVESYFPDTVGRNNVLRSNCVHATHPRSYYRSNGCGRRRLSTPRGQPLLERRGIELPDRRQPRRGRRRRLPRPEPDRRRVHHPGRPWAAAGGLLRARPRSVHGRAGVAQARADQCARRLPALEANRSRERRQVGERRVLARRNAATLRASASRVCRSKSVAPSCVSRSLRASSAARRVRESAAARASPGGISSAASSTAWATPPTAVATTGRREAKAS